VTRAALRCRRVIEGRHLDRIAIIGGARLNGEIPVSGAKNSAIKLMAASLLTDEPLRLTNMPRLADTRFLGKLLSRLGVSVTESDGADGQQTLSARARDHQRLRAL
jgi:UDP-N-acetylglucosamine 1-carboxyvinyltransferase